MKTPIGATVFVLTAALAGCTTEAPTPATPPPASADSPHPAEPNIGAMHQDIAVPSGAPVDLSGIPKADGGKTVAEVFADKASLAGKSVKLRGRVVKTNSGILGKNWIHVRDGSGEEGTNDLTVTTQGTADVGQLVVVEGVLALDKDFGAGYRYAVILEDASVTVE